MHETQFLLLFMKMLYVHFLFENACINA